MNTEIRVKGLEGIAMNYASRITQLRNTLNNNLMALAEDWTKASANTFVFKDKQEGFKKITEVTPLKRLTGGTRGTQRAKITLSIEPTSLTDFVVTQQRISIEGTFNIASVKKGKHREKSGGKRLPQTALFTNAKILRQGQPKLVQVKLKPGTLSRAEGIKGYLYSPTNRVAAKPETPLGVYVRLQQATWYKGKRLPTYKINAPPLAIIMLSPRILRRIKFYSRLENILDTGI